MSDLANDINEVLPENWTSIDIYYKGVHVKKSISKSMKPSELIETIDAYLSAGFEPSWNNDTNKAHSASQEAPVTPQATKYTCRICGEPAEFKQGISKAGKPWKGYFCSANKEHVSWLR